MFSKILIANRGEIACRVIRTAKRLGIATVAVYSEVDAHSLHVQAADQAICIGKAAATDSYLRADKILNAAKQTGAQAIHPGYGFLSENAEFARACAEQNIVFIGPPAKAIEAMGSKSAAKSIMAAANVPLVPGYHGDDQDPHILKHHADQMTYPVLLKATAGGGGKGMRQVWSEDEFNAALTEAKSEAMASFGDDNMLVEKYLTAPRHVELQIFCDAHGNGVYLFERDCSLQRRHQKVIEEAPAPNLDEDLRQQMGQAAVRAAQAIDYQGAGTVEFLLDTDGAFYFMEMNTRLQVEHPVTEMITGLDLVEWQLDVAAGKPLAKQQSELAINDVAVEARIYAEDPSQNFTPVTGRLNRLITPAQSSSVRIDTGVQEGDTVSAYYDPMIAKLICAGKDRQQALARLSDALSEYFIAGLTTNIEFLHDLATHPEFVDANLTTRFIEHHEASLARPPVTEKEAALAACYLYLLDQVQQQNSIWGRHGAWRLNQTAQIDYAFTLLDQEYLASISTLDDLLIVEVAGQEFPIRATLKNNHLIAQLGDETIKVVAHSEVNQHTIKVGHRTLALQLSAPDFGENEQQSNSDFTAPMNGTIVALSVTPGQAVEAGDALMVIEAMKMQHTVLAPAQGSVSEFYFAVGDLVDGGASMLEFDYADDD